MKGDELFCFEMIGNFGTATSKYMEAIEFANGKAFDEAKQAIKDGELFFNEGHKVHAKLLQKFANNEKVEVTLLLLHTEDQMMNCETIKIMAKEMIRLYQVIQS